MPTFLFAFFLFDYCPSCNAFIHPEQCKSHVDEKELEQVIEETASPIRQQQISDHVVVFASTILLPVPTFSTLKGDILSRDHLSPLCRSPWLSSNITTLRQLWSGIGSGAPVSYYPYFSSLLESSVWQTFHSLPLQWCFSFYYQYPRAKYPGKYATMGLHSRWTSK